MNSAKNILLTGLPRSGTSLAASLIDALESTVCIKEPQKHVQWIGEMNSAEEYAQRLKKDFLDMRHHLLNGGTIENRYNADGTPVTNYYGSSDRGGKRPLEFELKDVSYSNLPDDFTLATKNNIEYVSTLPELLEANFTIIGLVRNPISTILSWRSIDNQAIGQGNIGGIAYHFWPEIEPKLSGTQNILERMVLIYELIAERFLSIHNSRFRLVKYEEMVDDPAFFSRMLGKEVETTIHVRNSNTNQKYNWEEAERILSLLLERAPSTLELYNEKQLHGTLLQK